MNSKKFNILPVKDDNESHHIKKDRIFNMPFRLCCIAKSQQGKTNLIVNLLSRPEFYKNDFKPENIWVISPSARTDSKLRKMIKYLKIPNENIYTDYSPELLEVIYENIQDEYNEAINDEEKPEHSLIYMDDVAFDKDIKKSNIVSKLFFNSRHYLTSLIYTSQKYSMLNTNWRENVSAMCVFPCSAKQLELINDDINYTSLPKKDFIKIFRKYTNEKPYYFMCVNFSNDKNELYLDHDFNPIPELNEKVE